MSTAAASAWLTRRTLCAAALAALAALPAAHAQVPKTPRIAFVSHAPTADVWWNSVRNAIAHAAEDFGVEVDYLNPPNGSIAGMVRILGGLANDRYAGVISTIADASQLSAPLSALPRRGLPLITVNSGSEAQSEQLGALMHIGQPEFLAGRLAGERVAKLGVRSFICFNHYPSNPSSTERCSGFLSGLGNEATMTVVPLTGSDTENQARAAAVLGQRGGTDTVLTLGPTSAHPVMAAIRAGGFRTPPLITFDLSSDIVQGIRQGAVGFAIDQQPYLQGYLSVALMAQALRLPAGSSTTMLKMAVYANPVLHQRMSRYGLSLQSGDGRHVHSGPGFVTQLNVDKVDRFSGQYR